MTKSNPWGKQGNPEAGGFLDLLGSAGESPARRGNRIWFYTDVDQESSQAFVIQLREAEQEALHHSIQVGEDPAPIHCHIHSYGGELFAGLAATDAILEVRRRVPVYTHIDGAAASAATMMSVAGTHRTIGRHAFILIHQISSEFWGNFEEMKDKMKSNTEMMKTITNFYMNHTKFQERQLKQVLKKDLWFPAKRAVRLGLADEIR